MFALLIALAAFIFNVQIHNPSRGNDNLVNKSYTSEKYKHPVTTQIIPQIPHPTNFNPPPQKSDAYNIQSEKTIAKVSERAIEKSPVLKDASPTLTPTPAPTESIEPSVTPMPTIYVEPSPTITPIVHPKTNPIPCDPDRRGITSVENINQRSKPLFTDEILCPL